MASGVRWEKEQRRRREKEREQREAAALWRDATDATGAPSKRTPDYEPKELNGESACEAFNNVRLGCEAPNCDKPHICATCRGPHPKYASSNCRGARLLVGGDRQVALL